MQIPSAPVTFSWSQISSSAFYYWKPSAYILPLMWEIPFHIHKEQQKNLYFYKWKSILITTLRQDIIKRKDVLFPHLK
jgi:hypothetical protein